MTQLVSSKGIFATKTFWLNAIALLVAILTSLMGIDYVKDNPQITMILVMVLNVLNVLLRFFSTDRPATLWGSRKMAVSE